MFRFEAVKKQRDAMLDVAKGELGEVMGRYNLAVELLTERRAALAEMAGRNPRPGSALDPQMALLRQRHLHALREEIERREVQLAELQTAIDVARKAVAEAHHALRAIEVLEERDREHWRLETMREEQLEIDEQVSQRYGRD